MTEKHSPVAAYCLAAVVSEKAIKVVTDNGGRGSYRDENPWLVAADWVADAQSRGEAVAMLLAAEDGERWLGWAWISDLTVVGLTAGRFDSRCEFTGLQLPSPIFEALDSVLLWPSEQRLEREAREGLSVLREHVKVADLHPYGICETPEYIIAAGRA